MPIFSSKKRSKLRTPEGILFFIAALQILCSHRIAIKLFPYLSFEVTSLVLLAIGILFLSSYAKTRNLTVLLTASAFVSISTFGLWDWFCIDPKIKTWINIVNVFYLFFFFLYYAFAYPRFSNGSLFSRYLRGWWRDKWLPNDEIGPEDILDVIELDDRDLDTRIANETKRWVPQEIDPYRTWPWRRKPLHDQSPSAPRR